MLNDHPVYATIATADLARARSFYEGTLAECLVALMEERSGLVTRDDLSAYRVEWAAPAEVEYAGVRVQTRSGLSQLAMLSEDLEAGIAWGERALELATRLGDDRTRAHALVNIGSATLIEGASAEASDSVDVVVNPGIEIVKIAAPAMVATV